MTQKTLDSIVVKEADTTDYKALAAYTEESKAAWRDAAEKRRILVQTLEERVKVVEAENKQMHKDVAGARERWARILEEKDAKENEIQRKYDQDVAAQAARNLNKGAGKRQYQQQQQQPDCAGSRGTGGGLQQDDWKQDD